MTIETTNIIAVLVVAFIPLIIGTFWYSKLAFGSIWMKLEGLKEEPKKEPILNKIIIAYVTYVFMAYVISILVNYLVVASVIPALILGVLVWFGFIVPAAITSYLWSVDKKPWGLYFLHIGYFLISILLMCVSLALWI